jgi:hypothetical protein
MSERRKTPRSRTILGGVISFNKSRSRLDCNVRNFSQAGAHVEFVNTALLPDEFDLAIARKEATFRTRTVWRSEGAAGVAFIDQHNGSVVPLDWARKLKAVETQNKALRRRISELSDGTI